jgi:hypothetical protein
MKTLTPAQTYAMACAKYAAGAHVQAEQLCKQVLSASPGHRDALMLLAVLAQRAGRTAEGDDWVGQAVASSKHSITLTHELDSKPRSPNRRIGKLLEAGYDRYAALLNSFEQYAPQLEKIAMDEDSLQTAAPYWGNVFLPVLDAAALYCQVAMKRPRYFVEIGSGNSTKFVARAIADHGLDTKIISIDPRPRAEIDALCDQVLRQPLESCDPGLFSGLDQRDIVFADNSHRAFMNSDVTVFFCEILPALASGVTVAIHDIFLPFDYPEDWSERYYSEQYLLASYLLAETRRFEVTLPMHFAASCGLGATLLPQIRATHANPLWKAGTSFWLEMR